MPPVTTQAQWFALFTSSSLPQGSGNNVQIGTALAEIAAAVPVPPTLEGNRVFLNTGWWRSYPNPVGTFTNGQSLPFGQTTQDKGRERIEWALSTKRDWETAHPYVPLPEATLQMIANELENDPPALVVPRPKGGSADIPEVPTFTIADSPEVQRLRGTLANRKFPTNTGAKKARKRPR